MINILIFTLLCPCLLSYNWTAVDEQIQQTIANDHFYGCQLGIYSHNQTLYTKAYGTLNPKLGLYGVPIQKGMKYDINYLTQVIGINSALMQLYDQQRLNITDRVSRHLIEFDNNGKRYITLQNVLVHNSGIQSTYSGAFPSTPNDLLKAINNIKLQYKTQAKFQYSELGYVVLGEMVAKMMNRTIEESIFDILIFAGLRDTGYHPKTPKNNIVPSGFNKGITQGTSTNKIAHFLNSAAGNAGIFSTLHQLGTYMQLMLNKGINPPFQRTFSIEVIDLFTTKRKIKQYNNTRALGWDTVPATNPPCGKKFSNNSFGLTDPTGSYVWADKDKNISIVLLGNGQFPGGKDDHSAAQGLISDAIMTVLGY